MNRFYFSCIITGLMLATCGHKCNIGRVDGLKTRSDLIKFAYFFHTLVQGQVISGKQTS